MVRYEVGLRFHVERKNERFNHYRVIIVQEFANINMSSQRGEKGGLKQLRENEC